MLVLFCGWEPRLTTRLPFFSEEVPDMGMCFSSPLTQFYSDLKSPKKGQNYWPCLDKLFYCIRRYYYFSVARPLFCPDSKEGLYMIIGYVTWNKFWEKSFLLPDRTRFDSPCNSLCTEPGVCIDYLNHALQFSLYAYTNVHQFYVLLKTRNHSNPNIWAWQWAWEILLAIMTFNSFLIFVSVFHSKFEVFEVFTRCI